MKIAFIGLSLLVCFSLMTGFYLFKKSPDSLIPTTKVIKGHLKVDIQTVGELEAARSIVIASSIKGDQGKIIHLVSDGLNVEPGQILVKLDPTPFEEKLEKLRLQIKEQRAQITSLQQSLDWEKTQAHHENQTTVYEIEVAKLELDKVMHGDGPQEIARLKGAMQKSWLKYEELKAYSQDLDELEKQGFLNVAEVKQVQKKLTEEQEAYETAKFQYDSYVQHVFPMQIKKAEAHLKRSQIKQEEISKSGFYKVVKATVLLEQAKQVLKDYKIQLREAKKELEQADILAPSSGMVVHREEYRSGQRRKPRVGDILVKNQPILDLPDLTSMMVKTRVRELDLFKLDIGRKVTVEIDAYPQLILKGTISSIGVLALQDLARSMEEKYFEVRITLDETDLRLRPGMTARATIHAQESQNVLMIPIHAIFEKDKQSYCYVCCSPDHYEKRNIHLGIYNEQWGEVKDGLQEGDCICLLNPLK